MVRFRSCCGLVAGLAALAAADAGPAARLHARRLLGSFFGIPGDNATFDYVVVGGGTAGLTIATRLAEQQRGRVAVVEAGSFYEISNGNLSQIPAMDGAFASKAKDDWHPLIDWGYVTAPQRSAYDTELHYPRGKCLGGSSARNYMAYQRGTRASYQMWADAVGDQSYAFDRWLPYFEKSVKFTPPNMGLRFANSTPEYDAAVMGDGAGPLSVSFSNYAQAFASWTTRGLAALGMPIISGFQSGSLLGQSYCMFTINGTTMTRDSSETSFLRRALDYPNYTVYQSTMAKRILFGPDRRATGVLVDTQGAEYVLTATKEVVVSAGVFGSPQLLMVSGVGPAGALRRLGIPVVADRPGVGQNMQDHVYFGPSYRVNAPTMSALQDAAFAAEAARQFNERAAGMYANPTTDVIGWEKVPQPLRSSLSAETRRVLDAYPGDWPEVEYIGLGAYLGYQSKSRGGDPGDGFNYASLAAVLCTPRSRGNLTVTSADNAVPPVINPNYFSHRADVEVAVAGYKRVRQFWNSTAVRPFVVGRGEPFPGLDVSTDAQLEDVIKKSFNTIYHAACTCAMGKPGDRLAVVDSHARVFGVRGLRVVDASSFPLLPPGHPMATVYALAEKIASDMTGCDS